MLSNILHITACCHDGRKRPTFFSGSRQGCNGCAVITMETGFRGSRRCLQVMKAWLSQLEVRYSCPHILLLSAESWSSLLLQVKHFFVIPSFTVLAVENHPTASQRLLLTALWYGSVQTDTINNVIHQSHSTPALIDHFFVQRLTVV